MWKARIAAATGAVVADRDYRQRVLGGKILS
jgi:hypothetical protein